MEEWAADSLWRFLEGYVLLSFVDNEQSRGEVGGLLLLPFLWTRSQQGLYPASLSLLLSIRAGFLGMQPRVSCLV
jgi:hypothetical protein